MLLPAVIMFTSAYAQTSDSGQVFLIPVGSDGTADEDAKIEMTRSDSDTFVAKEVSIEYGFIIRGYDSSSGLSTDYSLSSWAVSPAVVGWLNPLNGTGQSYIAVAETGSYDVYFYSRQDTDYSLSMCELKYSSAPDATTYPDAIYLVPSSGQKIRIDGSNGVYTATVTLPASFKIAYEPNYKYEAFIFGSATSDSPVVLQPGIAAELAYAQNTASTFSYDSTAPVNSDGQTQVTIDLASPTYTITVSSGIETGIGNVDATSDKAVSVIYDTFGRQIENDATKHPGIYIVRYSTGETSKMLVR